MKQSFIKFLERPSLKHPLLIVGLPGVGSIGKIVAEFLIDEVHLKKLCTLFSPHFPYHVVISKKGIIRLLSNDFFYSISEETENDLLVIKGDSQAQTLFGQYEVANLIIDFCKEYKVAKIITAGGYAVGSFAEEPRVYGAVNKPELIDWIKSISVEQCEIGSPIVGAAGLLIGLASLWNIDGLCLLGETPGYIKDTKAAKNILEKITKFLDLKLDLSKLDEMGQKLQKSVDAAQEIEKQKEFIDKLREKIAPEKKDLSYFG